MSRRSDGLAAEPVRRPPPSSLIPEPAEGVGLSTAADLIADGELVAMDGERESFSLLQSRLAASPGRRGQVPVRLYLFDLAHLAGHDVRSSPLVQRKELLAQAIRFSDTVRYTEHVAGSHDQMGPQVAEACRRGVGRGDRQAPGEPLPPWTLHHVAQAACTHSGAFVVGGFTVPEDGRAGFGALLLGTQEDRGVLRYVGKVGSGFSDRALHTIRSFLGRIEVPASTFTDVPSGRGLRFVEPIVVVEVDHAAWTPAGRLRHPRFVGVVLDRADPEVVIAVDDHGRPSSVGRDGCRPPPV